MRIIATWADEARAYSESMAADPCAARGHSCRCYDPAIERLVEQQRAQRDADEATFRGLFLNDVVTDAGADLQSRINDLAERMEQARRGMAFPTTVIVEAGPEQEKRT